MRTAQEYLKVNDLIPQTGLRFTCNDYEYLNHHNYTLIVINEGRFLNGESREEVLSKIALLNRIISLAKICIRDNSIGQVVIDQINNNILIPNRLTPLKL